MLDLLWLVPALPFAGFLLLTLFGKTLSRRAVAAIGVGSMFGSRSPRVSWAHRRLATATCRPSGRGSRSAVCNPRSRWLWIRCRW